MNKTRGTMGTLKAIYDSRKSFYNKAWIETIESDINPDDVALTTEKKLYSYNTLVAKITILNNGYNLLYKTAEVYNMQSQTTLRHIKEFLKQNGMKAESKAQIEKDYFVA